MYVHKVTVNVLARLKKQFNISELITVGLNKK